MGQVLAYNSTQVVTTPTAGQVLASVTVLGPDSFHVAFQAYYTGTPAAPADSDNIALQCDPVTSGSFLTVDVLPQQAIANAPLVVNHMPAFARTTIRLIAIGNATSGAVYHVQLSAAHPGPAGAFV